MTPTTSLSFRSTLTDATNFLKPLKFNRSETILDLKQRTLAVPALLTHLSGIPITTNGCGAA